MASFWPLSWSAPAWRSVGNRPHDLDQQLQQLAVQRGEDALLPELYRVPAEAVEAERQSLAASGAEANDNVPLLWSQSLWLLGQLLLARWIRRRTWIPAAGVCRVVLGVSGCGWRWCPVMLRWPPV